MFFNKNPAVTKITEAFQQVQNALPDTRKYDLSKEQVQSMYNRIVGSLKRKGKRLEVSKFRLKAEHINLSDMASIMCKCGNRISNSTVPNDIQYYVYSDREWIKIIEMDVVETINLPHPKYDVWKCDNCQRIYIFGDNGKILKTYSIENTE